jgi:predicted GIY-YIG superfamily endonuclease
MSDSSQHTFESLELSWRARTYLCSANVNSVEDLLKLTRYELSQLPQIGRSTVSSIVEKLASAGLELRSVTRIQSSAGNSHWTYLLVSVHGETYLGATSNLRARFRGHNDPRNRGSTRGRRWHILGLRQFDSRAEAFQHEAYLKKNHPKKIAWIKQCSERARRLSIRHKYTFDRILWKD